MVENLSEDQQQAINKTMLRGIEEIKEGLKQIKFTVETNRELIENSTLRD